MSWRYARSSVPGTSHVKDSTPCQDYSACAEVDTPVGRVLVVVVADGAGSAALGGRAAELACEDLLARVLDAAPHLEGEPAKAWLEGLVRETRSVVLAEAEETGVEVRALASTLLCLVAAPSWSAAAQVGDGVIVTRTEGEEHWELAFWPQQGEYASTTNFLCEPHALEVLGSRVGSGKVTAAAVLTDGLQPLVLDYATRKAYSPFFNRMTAPLRDASDVGELPGISAELKAYLELDRVRERTDDDLTLVLAHLIGPEVGDGSA
jgi:hypothetical protein